MTEIEICKINLSDAMEIQKTGIGKALVTAAEIWAKENIILFLFKS